METKGKILNINKGSRKKAVLFLKARTKPLNEKEFVFYLFFQRSKISTAIKLEGVRGARP